MTKAWYLEERAESLALMYLTRRKDLIVQRQETDYGLDFLITIGKGQAPTGRIFGLEVKAALSLGEVKKDEPEIPNRFTKHERSLYGELPFPVCLFFFTMENDKAYYRWIKEPVVETDKAPKLEIPKAKVLKSLGTAELNKIVSKVNRWYDKRNAYFHGQTAAT